LVSIVGITTICSNKFSMRDDSARSLSKKIIESTGSYKNFGDTISNQVIDQPEGFVGEGVAVVE
jgi:hypothetical protein